MNNGADTREVLKRWLMRLLAGVLIVLVAGVVALLVAGLWVGEIGVGRWDDRSLAVRSTDPIKFWLAVTFQTIMATVWVYIAYLLSRAVGFIGENETLDRLAAKLESALSRARRVSLWIVALVIGIVFLLIPMLAIHNR